MDEYRKIAAIALGPDFRLEARFERVEIHPPGPGTTVVLAKAKIITLDGRQRFNGVAYLDEGVDDPVEHVTRLVALHAATATLVARGSDSVIFPPGAWPAIKVLTWDEYVFDDDEDE